MTRNELFKIRKQVLTETLQGALRQVEAFEPDVGRDGVYFQYAFNDVLSALAQAKTTDENLIESWRELDSAMRRFDKIVGEIATD